MAVSSLVAANPWNLWRFGFFSVCDIRRKKEGRPEERPVEDIEVAGVL
jgi:hypothetical protein